MKKEDLLIYELPTIAESISFSWGQEIIAKYLARKINRKWKRYEHRLKRAKYLQDRGLHSPIK
jgi:hypothetical protein